MVRNVEVANVNSAGEHEILPTACVLPDGSVRSHFMIVHCTYFN